MDNSMELLVYNGLLCFNERSRYETILMILKTKVNEKMMRYVF